MAASPESVPAIAERAKASPSGEVVSVAILSYNGGELFRRAIERILSQRIDAEIDVVLVDSGSTDGTERLDERYPVRMVRIEKGRFGYGYARNLAFASSRGQYIATISQDFVPMDEHWLERLVAPLRNGAHASQCGQVLPTDRVPFYWETRRFFFTSEGKSFVRRYGRITISCVNMATRRDVWEQVGFGDDVPMSEDKYFHKGLFQKGLTNIVHVPEATGYHGHQYTLKSLFTRCENEGLGWRWIGETYSLPAMVVDLLRPNSYAKLFLGLIGGKIRSTAELLFIWVRPIAIYKGNRFNRKWKR